MKNLEAALQAQTGHIGPSGAMRAALAAVGVDPDGEAPVPQGETVEPRWWEEGELLPSGKYFHKDPAGQGSAWILSNWVRLRSGHRRFGPFATEAAAQCSYDAMQATQNARVYKAGETVPEGWKYSNDLVVEPECQDYKTSRIRDFVGVWPLTDEGEAACRAHYAAAVEAAKVTKPRLYKAGEALLPGYYYRERWDCLDKLEVGKAQPCTMLIEWFGPYSTAGERDVAYNEAKAKQPAPASEDYGWAADLFEDHPGGIIESCEAIARESARRAERRWAEERERWIGANMRLTIERDELAAKLAQPQPVASGDMLSALLRMRDYWKNSRGHAVGRRNPDGSPLVESDALWEQTIRLATRLEALEARVGQVQP